MIESDHKRLTPELIGKLWTIPLFADLDQDRLDRVVSLCRVRQFKPGEVLVREGETDRSMYILLEGAVEVLKQGMDIVSVVGFGEIIGEMAILDGSPRSATVKAVKETLCLAVDIGSLDELAGDDKVFFKAMLYRDIAIHLAERIRKSNVEIVGLKYRLMRSGELV